MGRRTVRCSEKHTPLNPAKDRVRRNWVRKLPKGSMIMTISHGALGVLDIMGWSGPIRVVDTDPGVIESTEYMRQTDYPELNLLSPLNTSIQTAVRLHCMREPHTFRWGAVDVDLAGCLDVCFPNLKDVLETLRAYKVHVKVLFTFRNGRDDFGTNAIGSRITWIKKQLPRGVKYVSHDTYNSGRINSDASRSKGSSMCIVEIQT